MTRLRRSFIAKVNKDPKILSKLKNDWHKRLRIFDKIMKKIDGFDLSKLSDDLLIDVYYEWYAAYLNEYGLAIGIQDSYSMHADRFLIPHFEKILKKKGVDAKNYPILMAPIVDTFITQEYKDRLRLRMAFGKKNFDRKLKEHVKKYYWVQNNYARNNYLDEKHYLNQINQMKEDPKKELERLEHESKELLKTKKDLIKKLDLHKESMNLIKITELFAYMQDERKKYVLIATYYQDLFLKEIQKRLRITREEAEYTYIDEIRELFNKGVDRKLLMERKKGCLVINTEKGSEVLSGKLAQDIHDKIFKISGKDVKEIKGIIACKGKITGVVKVVRTVHDLINVHDKAVLVASMTRPEMVVAIKRAAAIVTDEGGITSHAAVVSRELKIPCIIGTKVATKVLKDGDLVEVDADRGVIRII
ncbi:MAG: hypothetical protein KKE20_03735 [Nanoarchaeota archaeon]|nr:hypothetical protein [Nanoarchaeota archaeon]